MIAGSPPRQVVQDLVLFGTTGMIVVIASNHLNQTEIVVLTLYILL